MKRSAKIGLAIAAPLALCAGCGLLGGIMTAVQGPQRPVVATASPTGPASAVADGWADGSPSASAPTAPASSAAEVPPAPVVTTTKPKAPAVKPTTRRADPPPGGDGGNSGNVTPGAFCAHPGATGVHNGTTYTCKGPGQERWRK